MDPKFDMASPARIRLHEVMDVERFDATMQAFYSVTGIAFSLADADGTLVRSAGWQDACTLFHRVCPATLERCLESDRFIREHLHDGPFAGHRCLNGLMDYAAPILVEDQHVGTIFTGQFLHEPPDEELFRRQAREAGFDEGTYLDAIRRLPVIPRERVGPIMEYFAGLASMLSANGVERLRLREARAAAAARADELRRSDERFRLLAESMVDVIWTVDPVTWRFTYVSPSVTRLRGYTPEEIMAEPVDAALTPEASQQLRAVVRGRTAAFESGESSPDDYYRNELEQPCRDGSTVWTEVITRYLRNPETGRVEVVGVTRDVSQRREAQEELRTLHAELEQRVHERTAALEEANRELEAFSYSVSHELRTPLRAIDGFSARIAAALGGTLDEEGRRLFAQVRWNAQRMGQLIDDLLAFSQAGRVDLRLDTVDMKRAARDAYAAVVADTPALWKVSFELGELPPVRGDAALLRRVWESLLSNAVKFTASRERPEIRVDGTLTGSEAVYSVRDNGIGFDMKYVGKLFGVFERLHGPTQLEGTGIGLALVRRIVTRHGGRVWAEGSPDRGARFSFSLPAPGSGL